MADDDEKSGDEKKEEDGKKEEKKEGQKKKGDEKKDRKLLWPWIVGAVVVLGFVAVVLYIIYAPAPDVWTDDSYVTAHYASVAPRVSGQVVEVAVDDNQAVKAGQVLVRLDDRDQRTALAAAEAMLEQDRARLAEAAGSVARQPALVDQAQVQNPAASSQLALALANQRRYRNLAATGAGTDQQRQEADQQVQQAQSAVDQARAQTEAARKQIPILEAQRAAAAAVVKGDEARVEQAKLTLSYTVITAPLDGSVAERRVQVGDYVAPGASVMTIVPLDAVYIVSNYREVALRHVLPGQDVKIHVDAYDIDLDGVVDSVAPASGAAFGAIQPNNATGNFTKIVQRLPVKILVRPGQNTARLLRLGFSVETTIHTHLADVVADQRDSDHRVTSP